MVVSRIDTALLVELSSFCMTVLACPPLIKDDDMIPLSVSLHYHDRFTRLSSPKDYFGRGATPCLGSTSTPKTVLVITA
eukprot:13466962-Heterocapsa_arctica.AAC.1